MKEEYKERKRKKDNKYKKEMREVAKDLGNCSQCFNEKENDQFKRCLNCRIRRRDWEQKRRSIKSND